MQEIADRVGIIRRGEIVEVAETQALIARALRRVAVRFQQPIDLTAITALPDVTLIGHDDTHCQLHVAGDMDRLIKTLALYPMGDLEIERTSLEEIFLAITTRRDHDHHLALHLAALARDRIIGWGLASAALSLIVAPLYNTLVEQRALIESLVKNLPPEFMAIIGSFHRLFSPAGLSGARYFSMLPLILGVFAVITGSNLIASDEENGTLDLILAQPVRRAELYLGRGWRLAPL